MWLSERKQSGGTDADLGITSIAGEQVGVLTRGEVRALPLYGPGGYYWIPGDGESVLVIKGGPGGEEQCVSGKLQPPAPTELEPGEVCICSGGASVLLKKDGSIRLRGIVQVEGTLSVNGMPWNGGE